MVKAILLLVLFVSLSPSYAATIYQWVDQYGTHNFTDDHEKIPSAYRSHAKLRVMEDSSETEFLVSPVASQKQEAQKDIYGLGEEWWRGRVRPWKAQLQEASEKYELRDREFIEESKMLIVRKLGSHQQFKSTVLGMERLRRERTEHEARLNGAKEILRRISRDAEESRADREWLNGGSASRQTSSPNAAEIRTDAYGRDEAWWRRQMFNRREQLKEAVENYEKAYEKYSKGIEELGPWRFGGLSLTQYQMLSCRLDVLNREIAIHQARMSEIKERLNLLVKEAEESRANPSWIEQ
jgi:hypothetical protein